MEGTDQLVPLQRLAREMRVDRSHFRRYVVRLGITPQKRHTPDSGNKLVVTVTAHEADRIRAARRQQGYEVDGLQVEAVVGVFYVVQLVPELDPNRVKLGFADDAAARLAQHRTAAPTAKLLKTWPCKRSSEFTVIDALSAANCKLILNEVYECCDLVFECLVSQVVIDEASLGDATEVQKRLAIIGSLPALDVTETAESLTQAIMAAGILPPHAFPDAAHVAVSAVHAIDYLLTWNCKHLANAQIGRRIALVCQKQGHKMPIVCTPEELMGG
ncbi:MAG TPA: type II toxin-antitoxin system VapC family toxin [Pirellulales bacterium]|nr:type II toxin-antitoxin system VapC family toxin [Pirellulales bacterium]